MGLHFNVLAAALAHPERTAILEPSGATLTYRELGVISALLRDRLVHLGVGDGDRVGVCLRKSADSVASLLGSLRAGAGYVPSDPTAPASRNAYIFASAGAKVVLVEARYYDALSSELYKIAARPKLLCIDGVGGAAALVKCLRELDGAEPAAPVTDAQVSADALAYILYTSGSTGRPKGVTLSHRNACSFVDWCSEAFTPSEDDRFSAHAPFHFDLSILDLWVSLKHGASLAIIDEELGKEPARLAKYISDARISIWYSAPSILSLLAQHGGLPHYDYSNLRAVLFAGEVFHIAPLRTLRKLWPHPRFYNLYGPTETNVCTYHEVLGTIPDDRRDPYPIGKVCSHLRARVVNDSGEDASPADEGELCIAGPAVTSGYWGQPELTTAAFLSDAVGTAWYKTGDLVSLDEMGDYKYLGRRDRMVKKRGYRVELGEIEVCLHQNSDVREAAVVAIPDGEYGILLRAHLGTENGVRLSLIKLKQFCAGLLPLYMVPDQFVFHASLPKTSTGKTDYQALARL
jgi:amino acid adenylation domain-containing protein